MDITKKLYLDIPEFALMNGDTNINIMYGTFGDFSLFFMDLYQLYKFNKIIETHYYSNNLQWHKLDIQSLSNLFERSVGFINEMSITNDITHKDILFTTVFEKIDDFLNDNIINESEFLNYFSKEVQHLYICYKHGDISMS